MDWIIDRLIAYAKRTPYFHLYNADGSTYMERYWLSPYAPRGTHGEDQGCYTAVWWRSPLVWFLQRFGIAVRLHWIASADRYRDLHDHPWNFVSIVLRGWYYEQVPDFSEPVYDKAWRVSDSRLRTVGTVGYRSIHDRHTISTVSPGGVWTLFITGRKQQSWGFFTDLGWIPHEKYNPDKAMFGGARIPKRKGK